MGVTDKVPVPARTDINSGLTAVTQAWLLSHLGRPGALTQDCSPANGGGLRGKIATGLVGTFRVTGHRAAVASLASVLHDLEQAAPETYHALASEGMLCCRAVCGVPNVYSNHSWGMAVDLRVGTLDELGSDHCAAGLLDVYRAMHKHDWYWGAGFSRRDAMHFEPSRGLLNRWVAEDRL